MCSLCDQFSEGFHRDAKELAPCPICRTLLTPLGLPQVRWPECTANLAAASRERRPVLGTKTGQEGNAYGECVMP